MKPHLVALGDLLLDVVVAPQRPIQPGTDVPGALRFLRGGSAANCAAAFVRAGGSAALITSLGDDDIGRRLTASLRADGVAVHAARHRGRSGRLVALVDGRGERSFVTERGAADGLRPSDIKTGWLRRAAVLHVPAYSLLAEPIAAASGRAATLAHKAGALLSLDLSSAGPLLDFGVGKARGRIAALVPDVLFANRQEAAALLGRTGRRAWPGLLDIAPVAVVKDGAAGCRVLWLQPDGQERLSVDVAAGRVAPGVDTTGAGDAFVAGFLYGLLVGHAGVASNRARSLRAAALAGNRAAAEALRRGRPDLRLG